MKCTLWSEGQPCYLCEANRRRRSAHSGHRYYKAGWSFQNGRSSMGLSRPAAIAAGSGGVGLSGVTSVAVDVPKLVEYCTEECWDDGSPRETATVLVFSEGGMWKGCINDRALARKGWASGATLEALLIAFEAGLVSGALDWRADQGAKPKRK